MNKTLYAKVDLELKLLSEMISSYNSELKKNITEFLKEDEEVKVVQRIFDDYGDVTNSGLNALVDLQYKKRFIPVNYTFREQIYSLFESGNKEPAITIFNKLKDESEKGRVFPSNQSAGERESGQRDKTPVSDNRETPTDVGYLSSNAMDQ